MGTRWNCTLRIFFFVVRIFHDAHDDFRTKIKFWKVQFLLVPISISECSFTWSPWKTKMQNHLVHPYIWVRCGRLIKALKCTVTAYIYSLILTNLFPYGRIYIFSNRLFNSEKKMSENELVNLRHNCPRQKSSNLNWVRRSRVNF